MDEVHKPGDSESFTPSSKKEEIQKKLIASPDITTYHSTTLHELFHDCVFTRRAQCRKVVRLMNRKGSGNKRSWSNRSVALNFLEWTEETHEELPSEQPV
jgi:hypothetical protein